MLYFFYDTETSGLPNKDLPACAPEQPTVMQLSGFLVDTNLQKVVSSHTALVKVGDRSVSEESQAIHGITKERSNSEGIELAEALKPFLALWRLSSARVGYVENFDNRMIEIALNQAGLYEHIEPWCQGDWLCLKKVADAHIRDALNGERCTLLNAHKVYTGESFALAHDACSDVQATIRLFFAMKERGHIEIQ